MAPKLRKRGSSVGSLRRAQSLVVESSNGGGQLGSSVSQGCTPVTLPLQIKESNQCWNDKATGATGGGSLAVIVTPPEEGWLSRSASFTAAQFPTPPSVPLRMPAARKRAALVQLNVDDTDAPFSIDAPSSNASAGPSTPCHVVHVVRSRRSSNASAAGSDAQGGEAEVTAGKSSSLLSRTNSLSRSQGGGDRLEARNLLAAAEMQAKEAAVTLRAANLDPKTTLARRWSEAVVLALASRMWHDAHPHAIAVIRRRQRAIAVFRRTIVPMWRDYVERRHRHATQVVSNFILRWVAKLRIRKRRAAAVMIIRFLKHPAQLLSRCAAGYRVRAIRLQRATRALLLRRKAQVELQLLRLRGRDTAVIASQGVEAEYWMQRAGRRCAFFDKSTWLTNLSAKSTDTNMELPRLPVAVLRRRLLDAVTVASRRYHRDILAWERESAFTSAQPWSSAKDLRSTTSGKYAAVDSSPRACNPFQAGNLQKSSSLYSEDSFGGGVFDKDDGALSSSRLVPSNSGGFAAMSQLSRMRRPIFKAFLSKEALFTALDEACRTTAVLRNDPRWAAHLQPQSSSS